MISYWPHQNHAHEECRRLFASGTKAWCLVAPCGAGKSVMMRRIAVPAAEKGLRVNLYTHRIMLTRQTIEGFEKAGVEFGVVASGFEKYENPNAKIQICSLDTVYARLGNFRFEFPFCDIAMVDEAHQQTATKATEVFKKHASTGAIRIGFSATPVDLGDKYQQLVSAGTYSEMLDCKAHLPIECYGPDRPDLSSLKPMASGEFSSNRDREINRVPTIIGRVYDYWQKLNPGALPGIGFAPGVAESRWFVEEFRERGVPCAHIDGERVVLVEKNPNGVLVSTEYGVDDSSRQAVIDGSRDGRFKIVWNRFVLREAVDMPWLYHAIAATSMGALSTWLQSIGRVQRWWHAYSHVILQDHGGNIDRHGPPDIDREWTLGCTNNSLHKEEVKKREQAKGDDAEPICCPKCCAYRLSGPTCPQCGYMHKRSVRMVRQLDGELVKKVGRTVKHKAPKNFDSYLRSAIFGCWSTGKSVKQAYWIATQRAKAAGVPARPESLHVPPNGSDKWHRSVREVYPGMRPKHMGAKQ